MFLTKKKKKVTLSCGSSVTDVCINAFSSFGDCIISNLVDIIFFNVLKYSICASPTFPTTTV